MYILNFYILKCKGLINILYNQHYINLIIIIIINPLSTYRSVENTDEVFKRTHLYFHFFQSLDVVENKSINYSQKLVPKYKLPQVSFEAFLTIKFWLFKQTRSVSCNLCYFVYLRCVNNINPSPRYIVSQIHCICASCLLTLVNKPQTSFGWKQVVLHVCTC